MKIVEFTWQPRDWKISYGTEDDLLKIIRKDGKDEALVAKIIHRDKNTSYTFIQTKADNETMRTVTVEAPPYGINDTLNRMIWFDNLTFDFGDVKFKGKVLIIPPEEKVEQWKGAIVGKWKKYEGVENDK